MIFTQNTEFILTYLKISAGYVLDFLSLLSIPPCYSVIITNDHVSDLVAYTVVGGSMNVSNNKR